jgi:hypothetical protein
MHADRIILTKKKSQFLKTASTDQVLGFFCFLFGTRRGLMNKYY